MNGISVLYNSTLNPTLTAFLISQSLIFTPLPPLPCRIRLIYKRIRNRQRNKNNIHCNLQIHGLRISRISVCMNVSCNTLYYNMFCIYKCYIDNNRVTSCSYRWASICSDYSRKEGKAPNKHTYCRLGGKKISPNIPTSRIRGDLSCSIYSSKPAIIYHSIHKHIYILVWLLTW